VSWRLDDHKFYVPSYYLAFIIASNFYFPTGVACHDAHGVALKMGVKNFRHQHSRSRSQYEANLTWRTILTFSSHFIVRRATLFMFTRRCPSFGAPHIFVFITYAHRSARHHIFVCTTYAHRSRAAIFLFATQCPSFGASR
jgi:hypothetical protein